MSIAQKIQRIVECRQNDIAPKFNTLWESAKIQIEFAHNLQTLLDDEKWHILLREYPEFMRGWQSISTSVEEYINNVFTNVGVKNGDLYIPKGYYEAIYHKIQKDTVEICITGPVSTGKSVFLRALTGAPEYVIPSGNSKTTAARTVFSNSATKSAQVSFYTTKEFANILNEYVCQLNKVLDGVKFEEWDITKENISEFCKRIKNNKAYNPHCFGKNSIPGVDTGVFADLYFETFQMYIDNVDQYKSWLDHGKVSLTEQQIENGELIKFVSYRKSLIDDSFSCIALAVQQADVHWPLVTQNDEDLGAIKLVDTMGIGEAKFCVESDLLKIVKEHADLAICLCRIHSNTQNPELKENSSFIKVLSNIRDRKLEEWVYYLCNKEDSVEISDETVEKLRKQIWKEMQNNAEFFQLNPAYWASIPFVKDKQPNANEIVNFFVNTVLGSLEKTITDIDEFFVEKLDDIHRDNIKSQNDILDSLSECITILPTFSDVQKNKEIDNEVDVILIDINQALKSVRARLFDKDEQLRQNIIDSIKPILKDPELFNIYGVEGLDFDIRAAFSKIFATVISAINYEVRKRDGVNMSWKDIEQDVISNVSKKVKEQNVPNLIKDQSEFFSRYLSSACRAIIASLNYIKSNLNIDDPKRSCNFSGRELEFFIEKREELYGAIWEKMSLSSEKVGVSDKDVAIVKDELCKAVIDVLSSHSVIDVSSDRSSLVTFVDFVKLIDSKDLSREVREFVESSINLPEIVDDQTGKELRLNLLSVNLNYSDEITAAKSTWECLFNLDMNLRKGLLVKYEKTFEAYNVFVNLVTPLYDRVFCVNQNEKGKLNSDAYKDFKAYIRNMVAQNYEKKDSVKCAEAAKEFRKICK